MCAGRNASRCCYCTVLSLFIRKRREKDGGIRKREQSVWRALCIHACATRSAQCTPDHGSSAFHSPSLSSSAGLPPLCASQHSPFFKEMKIFSVLFKECVNLSTHWSQAVCTSITKNVRTCKSRPALFPISRAWYRKQAAPPLWKRYTRVLSEDVLISP